MQTAKKNDNVVHVNERISNIRAITLRIDELDTFHGRRKISSLLRAWLRAKKGRTYSRFAVKVALSPTTVSRFASDETKWVRDHTLRMIMKGLGFYAITYHPADVVDNED